MSAFAALSLQNNAAVAQTFNPQSKDASGVSSWLGTETVLDAKKKVTMSVTLPKNGSTVSRVKQRVIVPVMDPADTTKKVAEAYVDVVFVLPKQASETVRLDLRKYADQLLINAVTTAAIQNFEDVY
jgi:hypothetical protein